MAPSRDADQVEMRLLEEAAAQGRYMGYRAPRRLRNPRSSCSRTTASQLPPTAKTKKAGKMKRIGLCELGRCGTDASEVISTPGRIVSWSSRICFLRSRRL